MGVVTRDVKSIRKSGDTKLKGDVTLTGGANITLTQAGQDISIAASGSTGAPADAQYVTLAVDGNLDAERVLVGGTGITLTDGGANNNATLSLDVSELGAEVTIASGDFIVMEDITDNGSQKITFANLEGTIDHGNLAGLSTGADHSYIDQDVTTTGTPTFGITTLGDSSQLASAAAPTADADIANKKYVDDNAGGSVATDAIWDAKGDLAGGTGADTAQKLTVGSDGNHLVADSGETTGLLWKAESDGNNNTLFGNTAGNSLTTGLSNTAVGQGTFDNETGGNYNVAVGYNALTAQDGGSQNTALGYIAGESVTTGDNNTLIGGGAGGNITSGSTNIAIGFNIDPDSATASNQLNIGGLIYGDTSATGWMGLKDFDELRFYDDGANYVGFEAPALTADQIWVLPSADGNADEVLTTDGAGTLSWSAGGSSSPLTTKGDIHTYDTGDARLGVGTNDQLLVADSAQSTGLKWAGSIPTGNIVGTSDTQTLTNKTIGDALQVDGAITQTGTAGHITLTPGTSKFVKVAVLRQDDTSDTYKNNSIILTGWGSMAAPASDYQVFEDVSFGITFDDEPIVLGNSAGWDATSGADLADQTWDSGASRARVVAKTYKITTTGFRVVVSHPDISANMKNSGYFFYTWIAIGELA